MQKNISQHSAQRSNHPGETSAFPVKTLRHAGHPASIGFWNYRGKSARSFFSLCILLALCIWIFSACTPASSSSTGPGFILVTLDPNSTATATPFQPAPATDTASPSATDNPTGTDIPTDTPIPIPTETFTPVPPPDTALPPATLPPVTPAPTSTRTLYTFYLSLNYAGKAAAVSETVRYVNITGQSLSSVVMAVEPNLWTNCFSLNVLNQDGTTVTNYTLNGQRLTIYPAQPVQPGAITTFSLGFSLSLPPKSTNHIFGYLSDQLNLTDWYPFIVPYSGGWVLHDPWAFGEHLVYDAADYDVNVKVHDPNVMIAASAPADSNSDSLHYHLEAARTFVLSASDQFKVDESAVGSTKISSYYFSGDENASKAVVWMATQSLGLYQAKFAPYPHHSLSIVETDVPDGQEYDGLVFLGNNFYSGYNGTAKSDLVTIGTHEIAHQWWFGLVGSDQALEPWLDEAMAVYSERIFYEYNYPNFGDWWWNFRVNYFGPSGFVDSSIYSFGTFRSYVNAVYLNGANFIDDLRTRIGDEAFFAFLRDYASQFSYGHSTSSGFFAVLRQHTNKDFSDILRQYFQNSY
jgi:hypothetical protein